MTSPHLKIVRDSGPAPEDVLDIDGLFRRYSPYVARIGLRILGRSDEVDDVVQDVFLIAAKGIHSLRNAQAARGWLATITVRVAKKRLRARKLRRWLRGAEDYAQLLSRPASAEHRSQLSEVMRVLDTLPAEERIAWIFRCVEGEPLEHVAAYCGISRATAHRRVVAAKNALKEVFGEHAP